MTVDPVAIIRYQYDNHLGSASLELDESADIISYEEYHPFGTTSYRSGRSETETSQKRYKYVGKERDEETGLYYYGFRYYAAWICRFVSVDPLASKFPFYSSYQYTGNNPITFTDLDGKETTNNEKIGVDTNGQQRDDPNNNPPEYYMNYQGFWIDGDNTFGEYVGNVQPSTNPYQELTKINNRYYHKNTSNLFSKVGNLLGGDFIEHKQYSSSEENFWEEMMTESIGLGLFKVGGLAFKALKKAGGSLWKLPAKGMASRGFVYEKMLGLKGLFKSHNFPVIDAFYDGVATSVKTMDVFAKSYKGTNKIYRKLKKYVDDLYAFNGREWGDDIVRGADIKSKVLEVGIPRGATKEQIKQINKAIKHAKSLGIEMNVRSVR